MGIKAAELEHSLKALGEIEPAFAAALARAGLPEPRTGERGYVTLLRAIIGQQVSVASANAIWNKLDAATGGAADPANMARTSDEALRGAGLSHVAGIGGAAGGRVQLVPDRIGRGHGDLLADDRAQQGRIAPLAGARLGQARAGERRGEGRLDLAQRLQGCRQVFARDAQCPLLSCVRPGA